MEPESTEGLRELVCLFLCGRDMLDGYELFGDMIVQKVMFEMNELSVFGRDRSKGNSDCSLVIDV